MIYLCTVISYIYRAGMYVSVYDVYVYVCVYIYIEVWRGVLSGGQGLFYFLVRRLAESFA